MPSDTTATERIRSILKADTAFAQTAVRILTDDTAGMTFLCKDIIRPLSLPTILIVSTSADADEKPGGVLLLEEEIAIHFVSTPGVSSMSTPQADLYSVVARFCFT